MAARLALNAIIGDTLRRKPTQPPNRKRRSDAPTPALATPTTPPPPHDNGKKRTYRERPPHEPEEPTNFASAAIASPGDVAEMCMALVQKAEDPWAVAQRLIPELQRIKREKGVKFDRGSPVLT